LAKGHRSQIKKERNKNNRETRAHAHAKFIRISDTKARIVLDMIKGKGIEEAKAILLHSPRYAAQIIYKVLNSAIANGEHNLGLDAEDLYVAECHANRGKSYYSRFRLNPRAKGRANKIERKVSHISVYLDEKPNAK
jgi:large subunit ribosomal protein L22